MGNILEQSCCAEVHDNSPESEITKAKSAKKPSPQTITTFSLTFNNFTTNDTINSFNIVTSPVNEPEKVVYIQKHIRGHLSRKKFKNNIDTLHNIYMLDSSVNVISNPVEAEKLILVNKGEQLYRELLNKKEILPYEIKNTGNSPYITVSKLTYVDKYKNNDLYIGGMTIEKKFSGYGVLYSNNNRYEGYWEQSKLNGKGRYFLANGDYFEGNIVNDKASGYGRFIHKDGTIYEGNWLNDLPNGEGKEIFKDGSTFTGSFTNGSKVKGKFDWKDGSYYEGEIKKDLFDGEGLFHWAEGREYTGQWREGQMEGRGVMSYTDGSRYEGEFLKGKRSGYGKYIWNENKIYEGFWQEGKQHGNGTYIKNGVAITGVWAYGKKMNERGNSNSTVVSQSDTLNLNYLHEKIPSGQIKSWFNNSTNSKKARSSFSGLGSARK